MKVLILVALFALSAFAADVRLKDFNWSVTDIKNRGLSKEALFKSMDRNFIKPSSSICSNRTLMWVNDFKNQHDIDAAKIFLFYTKKKGDLSTKTWWYHVAPMVNENGTLWTMDAGFGSWINGPISMSDWLYKFTDSRNCKEINASETDLVELIFNEAVFPHQTRYGYFDCYYKIVPYPLWTPESVAKNLLGRDSAGRPIQYERHEIDANELYQACLEATTSSLGYALGTNKKECRRYAGLPEE